MENTEANSSEMLKTKIISHGNPGEGEVKPRKTWGGGDHLSKSMGQGGGRISESEDLIGHRNNPIN